LTWRRSSGSLQKHHFSPEEKVRRIHLVVEEPRVKNLCLAVSIALAIPRCAFAADAPAQPSPSITYGPSAVMVSGVTPHGKVVLFGAGHEARSGNPPIPQVLRRVEMLVDSDGDGSVQLDLGHAVPPLSIWIAVDVTTGTFSGRAASDFPGASLALITPATLLQGNPGSLSSFGWPYAELALLVVRPRIGAWQIYAAKHSALDERRGTAGRLQINLGGVSAVGDTTGQPGLPLPGDVLAVIDPRGMHFGILGVGR